MKNAPVAPAVSIPPTFHRDLDHGDEEAGNPLTRAGAPLDAMAHRSRYPATAQDAPLDWARGKPRSGPQTAVFAQCPARVNELETAPELPAVDYLSCLRGDLLDTIASNFEIGGVEPARLAVAGKLLNVAFKDRAKRDRLVAALHLADAETIVDIIVQAQTLPLPLRTTVLTCSAARITRSATQFACIAAPLEALRRAIGALPSTTYRKAAYRALTQQFCDERFQRVLVTPALDEFFKACRTDIVAFGAVPIRQELMTSWAAGLRMMRNPGERLVSWGELYDSDRSLPARADLVISLVFSLKELEPLAARLARIDALIDEMSIPPIAAQQYMFGPLLQAVGTSAASREERASRFNRMSRIAASLPPEARQLAMQQLIARLDLANGTERFDIMRSTIAQVPVVGSTNGSALLCAIIKSIPYLRDDQQRELAWQECARLPARVPKNDVIAVTNALIDVIPCMRGAEGKWHRLQGLIDQVSILAHGQQALAVPHLLTVIGERQLGPHFWTAMTRMMPIVQVLPPPQRAIHLCNILGLLRSGDDATELLATIGWVQANAAQLPPHARRDVTVAMSNVLPVFANHQIIELISQFVEEGALQLDDENRDRVEANIERGLLVQVDALHSELYMVEPAQFLLQFSALVRIACKKAAAGINPVIAGVLDLVKVANDTNFAGLAAMLRCCRDTFPAALQHLVGSAER